MAAVAGDSGIVRNAPGLIFKMLSLRGGIEMTAIVHSGILLLNPVIS
jgi:hypothetical protein